MTFRRHTDLRIAYERYAANLEYRLPCDHAKTDQSFSRGQINMPGCDAENCPGHEVAMVHLQDHCGRRNCENMALLPVKAKGTEWWCCAECMKANNADAKLQGLLDRDETITPDEARDAMHNAAALNAARSQRSGLKRRAA